MGGLRDRRIDREENSRDAAFAHAGNIDFAVVMSLPEVVSLVRDEHRRIAMQIDDDGTVEKAGGGCLRVGGFGTRGLI